MGGLEEFLKSIDHRLIRRVWFDFKNLNKENSDQALAELERLDKIFGIKSKFIIESGKRDDGFATFAQNGWHSSYYLPTGKINELLQADDKEGMKELAKSIALQAKNQKLKAVSFDNSGYRFVKEYLEPKLQKEIVFHSWYGPSIKDTNFANKIENSEIYQDKRIKTFLSPFDSNFGL